MKKLYYVIYVILKRVMVDNTMFIIKYLPTFVFGIALGLISLAHNYYINSWEFWVFTVLSAILWSLLMVYRDSKIREGKI